MNKLCVAFGALSLGGLLPLFAQPSQQLKFTDLLLPLEGQQMSSDAWGCKNVGPRLVDNGFDDPHTSVWGSHIIKGDDGLFHMFVCAWDEELGYRAFRTKSNIVHATSDKVCGPYAPKEVLGYGFDPEVFRTADGTYVVKVWEGQYSSKSLYGPWTFSRMTYDARGRFYYKGSSLNSLSNMTYTQRPDGSYVCVDRGGAVWVSKDGLLEWTMVSDLPVFSVEKGFITDPVIWHDNVQYYMMDYHHVNQYVSFYRSIDGLHWQVEETFPARDGLARHADGSVEKWGECSRFKVLTDEVGRVEDVLVSVCDIRLSADSKKDDHNSKALVIPFVKSRLLEVASPQSISPESSSIDIIVKGEDDFHPAKELDVKSLRLGSYKTAAAGKGLKAVKVKKVGKNDAVVSFVGNAGDLGIDAQEWALRMVGKNKNGKIVHGFVARPGFGMNKSHILSAMMPMVDSNDVPSSVEVENFGVSSSPVITAKVCTPDGVVLASGSVDPLAPYSKCVVRLNGEKNIPTGTKALSIKFFDGDLLTNETYMPTRNINSFQERLIALVDSARALSEKDAFLEGKMELQMAMMDGLSNISRFDLAELQESYSNLEAAIADFYTANGVDVEFFDFYSWARNDNARVHVAPSFVKVKNGNAWVDVSPIDNISDGKTFCNINGRVAIVNGSRHFDLRNNGEGDKFTGLFDYMRTAILSIRNLSPGTRISINCCDLFLLDGSLLCADGDPEHANLPSNERIVSGKTYVVKGEPGQSVNVDFRGEHYTCVYSIKIEKPVVKPEPPKAAPKLKRSAKKK